MGTKVIVDGDIIGHSTLTKLRQVLTELDDTFAKDISKTIVSAFPNNISLKSHRLLCSIDGFAIGICSGHIDGLYSKLFNAYSLFKENTVHSLILIAKSSKEAWWKNQEGRIRNGKEMNSSLGNRQNWGLVKSGIKSSSHWFDMPITGLILERDISVDGYNQFKW